MKLRITAWLATPIGGLLSVLLCASLLALSASAQDTPVPAPPPPTSNATTPDTAPSEQEPAATSPPRYRREVVHFGSNAYLGANEAADAVVAVGGNATSEGNVRDAVVSIFGKTHVTGEVRNTAVAVFGDVFVDGRVGREVIAVFGNVTLGPSAVIEGDVRAIGGAVNADPAAKIEGDIEQVSTPFGSASWVQPWFKSAVLLGRPLAFEPGLSWAWQWAAFFLVVYVLIALLWPRPLTAAAATFEQRPGEIVLAAFLTLLLLPLVGLTLVVTIIGIVLVPFVWLALLFGVLFGKAAVLASIGRRFTRFFGDGPLGHVAVAVALGGGFIAAVYTVPVLGFLTFVALGLLGLGVMSFMLVNGIRTRQRQRRSSQEMPRVDLRKAPSGATTDSTAATAQAAAESTPQERPTDATLLLRLPRAGFWIRSGALLVDVVLVAVLVSMAADEEIVLIALAGYGALMWKLKGTTIGGTLCNLQVVRVDGREIDWATALVRALSCFLSLIFAGLGFIWIAFDPERQAWHDKIAGTVVVRTVKTVALV